MKRLIILPLLLAMSFIAWSQVSFNLSDIYKNVTYSEKGYGLVGLMKDNKGYYGELRVTNRISRNNIL